MRIKKYQCITLMLFALIISFVTTPLLSYGHCRHHHYHHHKCSPRFCGLPSCHKYSFHAPHRYNNFGTGQTVEYAWIPDPYDP